MAEIVGTITNLSDFLSKTQVCLSVKPNDPQQQIICLEADRKYSIPAFQREVRWDDNNLKMLLYDLSRSSKFLGNIILTIKSDHTCEIIDGQQRTTVLMLIVSCIKKKFGTKISTPDLCPLRNEESMLTNIKHMESIGVGRLRLDARNYTNEETASLVTLYKEVLRGDREVAENLPHTTRGHYFRGVL